MKNKISGPLAEIYRSWSPHPVQIQILNKLFSGKYKEIFVSCGRKMGKTEVTLCAAWHTALEKPGSTIFYITPSREDGRRILWHNNRLSGFGPESEILRIDNENSILHFKNGSMIVLLGSGKYSSASGLTPDLAIFDEYAEINPDFVVEFDPNRAVHNCPVLYIGTLPLVDARNREGYFEKMKQCKEDPEGYVASYPSWANPYVSKEFLKKKKAELFSKGLDYLWYLQYASKYVVGGKNAIFPMFKKDKHVYKDGTNPCKSEVELHICIKPSNTTKSGALFISYDPETKKVNVLDEYYTQDVDKLSTQNIIPVLQEKANKIKNISFSKWTKVSSKRSPWFSLEASQYYNVAMFPTSATVESNEEHGISLMKDMFTYDMIQINEKCKNFINEVQYYVVNSKGNLKGNADTLINCFRYFLDISYYDMKEIIKDKSPKLPKRASDWDGVLRTTAFDGDLDLTDWTEYFE